jgi:hypothetical protein
LIGGNEAAAADAAMRRMAIVTRRTSISGYLVVD